MPLRSCFTLAAPKRSVCLADDGHYMPTFDELYVFHGFEKDLITDADQLQAAAIQVR